MKTMTIKPFLDYVIIKPDVAEDKTESGVYLPASAVEKPLTGEVVAVGSGVYALQTGAFIPTSLKVGERVMHGKYQTTEVQDAGETYLMMKESNVMAIL